MPPIEVRPATPGGATGIAGVHISSWQGAYAHVFPAESLAALGLGVFGFEEATLWVLEDSGRARRFYEAAGWTADGA